ncbi:type I-F CRISPR-associated protein Csy1 [Pseudomonas sp. JZ134]|uniref:type I-F CRISPR-associated protein Csy1 n=1 Tax=Pseudomonas sp. JZ134 TaxID=2806615 RepID=UPI003DA11881
MEEVKVSARSAAFRQAIAAFINERREAKLKGTDDEQSAAKYEYTTWLTDAARRVSQIQAVTHVLKATHPDARGSSLYVTPNELPQHIEIGTHCLGDRYDTDIVGNAAALDVYKFLKLDIEGLRLLDWFQQDDPDLLAALHHDPAIAREWADAFKSLIRGQDSFASHPMAKQIYWCVSGEPTDDAGFHLLQPLFSSSLTHAVHQNIQDARFGESNKLARQARREKAAHDSPCREYLNLVARKLGGTKPQNISQLNSDRGGVNYLLASLPPTWSQDRPRKFLYIDSVMPRFIHYEGVRELVEALCRLLESNPGKTMETRVHRERIEQALGQSLAAFGMEIRHLFQPGWTRDDNCRLPLCEQIWLDPERTELAVSDEHRDEDLAFIEAYEWKNWPNEVAHRFGNWLNGILQKRDLPVGDVEHAHWARQAIIDADWPASMQRRALPSGQGETSHE